MTDKIEVKLNLTEGQLKQLCTAVFGLDDNNDDTRWLKIRMTEFLAWRGRDDAGEKVYSGN